VRRSNTKRVRDVRGLRRSLERRERDSNPRYGFIPYAGLANRCLQPLGHLSRIMKSSSSEYFEATRFLVVFDLLATLCARCPLRWEAPGHSVEQHILIRRIGGKS
jgi:hypothetical protein